MKIMLEWWGPKSGKRFARICADERQADITSKWLSSLNIRWKASAVDKGLAHLKVK